jgi:putative ATP-dependent endonuclease of the OLD family
MKITSLVVKNYRTLADFSCQFADFYTAISGKNNHGKSNILRALKAILLDPEASPFYDESSISYSQDFSNWLTPNDSEKIKIEVGIEVHKIGDAGLYRWLSEFVKTAEEAPETYTLTLGRSIGKSSAESGEYAEFNGVAISDGFKVTEIFKKLQTAKAIIFHNSTESSSRYFYGRSAKRLYDGMESTTKEKDDIKAQVKKLQKLLEKSVEAHQKDIVTLLGRLEEKYTVRLSPPQMDFDDFPVMISLGDKNSTVPIDDWGSGTRNRTLILLQLMRAKRMKDTPNESDRITPIILLEEAESFLHPSAQAEFGQVLQDMAREFEVQVITTTHSPYLLSIKNPACNILLSRETERSQQKGTTVIETAGDFWMEPFGQILGVKSDEFKNWRNVLFQDATTLLLVEGPTDKWYLESLRDPKHGCNALNFDGEIFPYEGTGFFDNTVLLKFLQNRFKKIVITFDLDSKTKCLQKIKPLGFEENRSALAVGVDKDSMRDIEGLVSERIRNEVYRNNPQLITNLMGTGPARESAKSELKRKILDQWLSEDHKPAELEPFYELVKKLNKAFK